MNHELPQIIPPPQNTPDKQRNSVPASRSLLAAKTKLVKGHCRETLQILEKHEHNTAWKYRYSEEPDQQKEYNNALERVRQELKQADAVPFSSNSPSLLLP